MSQSELRLRAPANEVSRRAILHWTLESVLFFGVLLLAGVITTLVMDTTPLWLRIALPTVAVIGVGWTLIEPRWRFRVHRWEFTEDAVYSRTGWVNQEWRLAPVSRIQTVDTSRGPLQQALHLATVTVTTASAAGPVTIAGLDEHVAAQLVAELTARTQATPGDAT